MNLNTFTTALSGLNANAQGLSVVGNNIANLNTVGFKQSNINFEDVLDEEFSAGSPGSSTVNLGLGTQVSSVRANFGSGSLQTTNNPLDVAIQGKGFLVLHGANGAYYSRAGNLHLDANNNLVADNGMAVQGYVRNPTTGLVDPNLGLQSIQLPTGVQSPVATSAFGVTMNLDGSAPTGTQFTSSIQLYDSTGVAHVATVTLEKQITAANPPVSQWNFDITIPTKDTAGAAANATGNISLITGLAANATPNGGTLVFDNSGNLTSAYVGAVPPATLGNLTIPPNGVNLPAMTNGATLNKNIDWKVLNPDGTPAISGYASPSNVTASSQNGTAAGSLTNVSVMSDGTISAVFTSGQTENFAQIALAQFGNVDGLTAANGGLYQESAISGSSFVGAPGQGGRGSLVGGALEQSNVDLATELTKILTFQRGYQANAKLITTTDQIMQQTLQMIQ